MANVDWSLQPTALRKVLLKLSKPKLIKLCKQKKISINHAENKKDIIDRLLNASKSSQKKQKDKNSKNVKNKKKIKKPDKVIKLPETVCEVRIFVENSFIDNKLAYGYIRIFYDDKIENKGAIIFRYTPAIIKDLIYKYLMEKNKSKTGKLIHVGNITLEWNMNMNKVKKEITNTFIGKVPLYMRLRHIWSPTRDVLTNIYSDDTIIRQWCYSKKDEWLLSVCCQDSFKEEQSTKNDKILRCSKVYKIQNKWYIHEYIDMLFDQNVTVLDIKQKINECIPNIDIKPETMDIQFYNQHDFNKEEYLDHYCNNLPWNDLKNDEKLFNNTRRSG
eukprot:425759_1